MVTTRAIAAVAGALIAVACPAGGALAHAQLLTVSPANGEVVSAPPAEVVLTFNEPVGLTGGNARVFGDAATLVSAAPVQSGVTVTIPLEPDLPDGTYTVTFEVVSADSHRITGATVFHVGAASSEGLDPAVVGGGDDVAWGVRLGAVTLSGIAYAAALTSIGVWCFREFIDRTVQGRRQVTGTRPFIVRSAVLGAVALVGSVPFRIARVGGGLDALRDNDTLAAELRGPIGQAVAVSALALIAFAATVERRLPAWLTAPVAVAAVSGFALEGHTRASHLRWAMIGSDVVHLIAGAVWLGGIVALVVAFRRRVDPVPIAVLVRRFSNAALIAVAVVSASGVLMAWIVLPTAGELTSTGYGLALIVKASLVIVVISLGAFNRWLLVPAVSGAEPRRRLSQVVVAELALLLAAVGTTAVLVTRSPVASVSAASASPGGTSGPTTTTAPQSRVVEMSDGGTVTLTVAPGRAGPNTVHVELRDVEGRIINPVDAPSVEFTQPEFDIGPLRPDGMPMGIGLYMVDADLAVAGEWDVEIRIRVSDFESVSGSTTITIGE